MSASMPRDTANRAAGAAGAAGTSGAGSTESVQPPFADRPDLQIEIEGAVAHLRLNRAHKRNAISDSLVAQLHAFFARVPEQVRAVLLSGEGKHFCAGLDLSEMSELSVEQGIAHSRMWHAAFDAIQFGPVPVVAVLHGAVVGGGLEMAAAAHIRVAEPSAFFGLPEGQRGLFVGGGGSARVPRLVGYSRMTDMMLTGRVLDSGEAHQVGLIHYLVGEGEGVGRGMHLAERIAQNARLSNFAIIQALPRIAELSQSNGLFVESLMAAIAQGDDAAKARMRAFLDGRADKVRQP